jgi:hypothetical protein
MMASKGKIWVTRNELREMIHRIVINENDNACDISRIRLTKKESIKYPVFSTKKREIK